MFPLLLCYPLQDTLKKIKQDTGAEVNVMPKCVCDKLSNGDASKSTGLLNKAQTTEITGYGQNPINYIGTCVSCQAQHHRIWCTVFHNQCGWHKGHFGLKRLSGVQIDKSVV